MNVIQNARLSFFSSVSHMAADAAQGIAQLMPESGKVPDDTAEMGDNNPPISSYLTSSKDLNDLIEYGPKLYRDMEKTAQTAGSQWEQVAILATDFLFFYADMKATANGGRKIMPMSLAELHKHVWALLSGKLRFTPQGWDEAKKVEIVAQITILKDVDPTVPVVAKGSESTGGQEIKAKLSAEALAEQKKTDDLANAETVSIEAMRQNIKPACQAAFLCLYGSDSIMGMEGGTSYRKVRRWLYQPKQPVVNPLAFDAKGKPLYDVLGCFDGDEPKGEELKKYLETHTPSTDTANSDCWPKGTYEGIAYDDWYLRPCTIRGDKPIDNPAYLDAMAKPGFKVDDKSNPARYIGTEWIYVEKRHDENWKLPQFLGATRVSVDKDYERFFIPREAGVSYDERTGLKTISVPPKTAEQIAAELTAKAVEEEAKKRQVGGVTNVEHKVITEIGKDVVDPVAVKAIGELKAIIEHERLTLSKPLSLDPSNRIAFFTQAALIAKSGLPRAEELEPETLEAIIDLYSALGNWGEVNKVDGIYADEGVERVMGAK